MSGKTFVHHHVHSEFSMLDGAARIRELVRQAAVLGMPALAITDHGALYGLLDFYEACHAEGIKPILGCLVAGQEVITASGVKGVEDVKVGDLVLTHRGRFRRVTRTMRRQYKGPAYRVHLAGRYTRPLLLTEEHPILVRSRDGSTTWQKPGQIDAGRHSKHGGVRDWKSWVCLPKLTEEKQTVDFADVLPQGEGWDTTGNFVRRTYPSKYRAAERWPVPTRLELDEDLAYLMGIYSAEGWVQERNGVLTGLVGMAHHQSERDTVRRIEAIAERFGAKYSARQRSDAGRRHSLEAYLCCLPLARMLAALVGRGAENKRVPTQVMQAPRLVRKAFVRGLVDGDGATPTLPTNVTNQATVRVTSRDLAWGLRTLLADLGHFVGVKETPAKRGRKSVYTVSYTPDRAWARTLEDDDYVYRPIHQIEPVDLETDVFNFEVEEDNSYVSDFVLHNCELYLARESRFSKLPGDDNPKTIQHITVLARNETGYRNLLKLATAASLEGLYYKPRVDMDVLAEHADGLIGTTGCLNGQVPRLIREGRVADAREAAGRWREIFGAEHFFIELQNHGIADQDVVNRQLVEFSSELGIPLLATNDLHYTHKHDAEAHDVLLCIQTGATVDEPGRLRFERDEFYLKSREEMEAVLGHYPEALDRTLDVADMCDVKLQFGDLQLPDFIPPDGSSLESHLRRLSGEGAAQRYGDPLPAEVRERLDYELKVICDMGFAGFFLIVADVVNWAKGKGIRVGPGRGSAAGTITTYSLGVTSLDPLRYGLVFERFLNPERREMPDFDIDFDERYRGEVIRYLREKYGEDRVAQIVTFCLGPDTRILTADLTWVPVKELAAGDEIFGFDEYRDAENPKRGRKYRRTTVVANESVSLPSYRISTDRGEVIASAGHLWLLRGKTHTGLTTRPGRLDARQGWVATEELVPGDRICWFGYPWETSNDRDAGWLAGIFDGEGSFDGLRIELAQNEGLVLDRITKTLTRLGFDYTISPTDHDCKHVLLTGGLYASLRFFGILRPERFAGAYDTALEGRRIHGRVTRQAVVEKLEFLGEQEVWAIETTTKTLIAEGLLSHNSTIKGKSAIRDAARVLGFPYGMGDRLAKMFPRPLLGKDPSLEDCFERSKDSKWAYAFTEAVELRSAYEEEPDARKVLDAARKLEGLRRQTGVHAAAVVVGREPLVNYTALQRTDNDDIVTQYEMHGIEKLGLLKVDILGLGNLTVIELTLELLRHRGITVDIDDVPLDDPKVFELLERGDVDGVFQLESEGMRRLLRSLRPDRFEDIVALIALYRPGPMQEIEKYIRGKHDPERITYPHPLLEDVLRDTYGVIVYQEQVLQLLQRIAGYTPGEADIVRKAVGKKVESLMKAEEPRFLEGAAAQGLSAAQARELWNLLLPFAGYSFNRAHSACYGLIAYQTAYLKAHYPVEYLSALLTSVRDSKDEKTKYLAAARKMGIEILPPDVNLSQSEFAPDPDRATCVRFGLAGIRNVGEGVVEHILAARREGRFKDFFDFSWRVETSVLNKRTIESLVKAGAFDSVGHGRGGLLQVFEQAVEQIASARRKESEGYVSLFDDGSNGGGDRTLVGSDLKVPDVTLTKPMMLAFEKEMLGQYVTDHPLAGLEDTLACQTDASLASLSEVPDGGVVSVAGIVNKLGKKFTRKGELMFLVELEDLEASCEVIVFPAVAEKAGDLVALDRILKIRGRVDHKDDAPKLVALEVAEPDYGVLDNPVRIRVAADRCTPDLVAELKGILQEHPGPKPVFLHLRSAERETVLRLGSEFRVDPGNGCVDRLRLLLGAEAVTL